MLAGAVGISRSRVVLRFERDAFRNVVALALFGTAAVVAVGRATAAHFALVGALVQDGRSVAQRYLVEVVAAGLAAAEHRERYGVRARIERYLTDKEFAVRLVAPFRAAEPFYNGIAHYRLVAVDGDLDIVGEHGIDLEPRNDNVKIGLESLARLAVDVHFEGDVSADVAVEVFDDGPALLVGKDLEIAPLRLTVAEFRVLCLEVDRAGALLRACLVLTFLVCALAAGRARARAHVAFFERVFAEQFYLVEVVAAVRAVAEHGERYRVLSRGQRYTAEVVSCIRGFLPFVVGRYRRDRRRAFEVLAAVDGHAHSARELGRSVAARYRDYERRDRIDGCVYDKGHRCALVVVKSGYHYASGRFALYRQRSCGADEHRVFRLESVGLFFAAALVGAFFVLAVDVGALAADLAYALADVGFQRRRAAAFVERRDEYRREQKSDADYAGADHYEISVERFKSIPPPPCFFLLRTARGKRLVSRRCEYERQRAHRNTCEQAHADDDAERYEQRLPPRRDGDYARIYGNAVHHRAVQLRIQYPVARLAHRLHDGRVFLVLV